jgi:hypothetical protein
MTYGAVATTTDREWNFPGIDKSPLARTGIENAPSLAELLDMLFNPRLMAQTVV